MKEMMQGTLSKARSALAGSKSCGETAAEHYRDWA